MTGSLSHKRTADVLERFKLSLSGRWKVRVDAKQSLERSNHRHYILGKGMLTRKFKEY